MGKMFDRLRKYMGERRKRHEDVAVERRAKPNRKEVEQRYDDAIEDLDRTVRMKREDLFRFSANDMQQVVIFSTFREICTHRLTAGVHRLCRHPEHEAANSGVAGCAEAVCPIMLAAVKGAA